jgi:hypothetical protein
MNTKTSIPLFGATALAMLLGCSTPRPDAPAAAVSAELPAPPMLSYSIPLERPVPPLEPLPAFCKLGTSCLALDPRPFEACLLSTKDCRDKATEPLLVGQPELIAPPAVIKTGD